MKPKFLAATLFGVIWSGVAVAATYHVSQAGSDGNSCQDAQSTTPSRHKASIAAGVACLAAGDTLVIHGGTYTGSDDVIDSQRFPVASGTSTNPITIAGAPGETVILRPPNNVSGIRLTTNSPSYLIFQDFVIDMARSEPSADALGVYSATAHHNRYLRLEVKNSWSNGLGFGRPGFNEVIDCAIHDNGRDPAVNSGYGVYITADDNLFDGNSIYRNSGYGMHMYGNSAGQSVSRNTIRNNRIYDNGINGGTNYGIVMAWGEDNVIYNNLVYGNRGGIEVYTASRNTQVFNNTVYGNAPYDGVAMQFYASAPKVQNNIVYGNAQAIVDHGGGTGVPVVDHNLTDDPSFTDAPNGDFSLRSSSAARDVGVPIPVVTDDFARRSRPQGSAYDIGAFEYVPSGLGPASPSGLQVAPR